MVCPERANHNEVVPEQWDQRYYIVVVVDQISFVLLRLFLAEVHHDEIPVGQREWDQFV